MASERVTRDAGSRIVTRRIRDGLAFTSQLFSAKMAVGVITEVMESMGGLVRTPVEPRGGGELAGVTPRPS